MIRARKIAIVVAPAIALLATACSSGGTTASSAPSSTPPSVTPSISATVSSPLPVTPSPVPTTPTPTLPPTPTPTAPPASPAPSASTCAQLASRIFIRITAVKTGPGGALTLTGNPAKLVCGGPDDSHYNVAKTTETGQVNPGASIMVFPLSKMHPVAMAPGKLGAYLRTDEDTRIFLVTGRLTTITGLQEQFHP
jgi:hypothetical protein